MSVTSTPEFITEAAGVKIYMTKDGSSINKTFTGKVRVTLENMHENKAHGKSCGFHLTKSKWDPYPWINYIDAGSLADVSGLRAGDCLIGIDAKDLIGLSVKQIALLIYEYEGDNLNLFVWRYTEKEEKEAGTAVTGPLSEVANKLANAISGVVRALECPVCLESTKPPVSQCVHGHIICVGCRSRTPRCPICRVRLGQGRCLLADKLHKILFDVFARKENVYNDDKLHTRNLRDWLFGKRNKTEMARVADTNPRPRKLLLSKLFGGGLEKAASADNLTVMPNATSLSNNTPVNSANPIERLNLYDRQKSASTGELANETKKYIANSHLKISGTNAEASSVSSSMSNISMTHAWIGSVDSVSCMQVTCPLAKQNLCEDIITPHVLLDHLTETHRSPQVHFYSNCAKLLLPHPFGSETIYVLHYCQELFFLRHENETIWISSTIEEKAVWHWTLHGKGQNDTEIKIRRRVASLLNPMVLSTQHIAPVPNTLLLDTLEIELIDCCSTEQLII